MLNVNNRQSHIQHTTAQAAAQQLEQQQHLLDTAGATHDGQLYGEEGQQHDVDLNFSNFAELCRLCGIHHGPTKLHIFEPQAEQRQLLYKLRSLLQANVSS